MDHLSTVAYKSGADTSILRVPRVDHYASRIPKMYCMKSQEIGHGRRVVVWINCTFDPFLRTPFLILLPLIPIVPC